MEYEGFSNRRLMVRKGFTLTEHLVALKINQTAYVRTEDYSLNTVYVMIHRLKKLGYRYKTKRKKRGKNPPEEIKVTRIA